MKILKILLSATPERNKVFVFIDDLDRCEVPKAADLMQALNLMISNDPHLNIYSWNGSFKSC